MVSSAPRARNIPRAAGATRAGAVAPPRARERLLDAALARFDAEGAHGTTLDEIRREAGVSVGGLYHHFPDKAALAAALYVELTESFQQGFLGELRAHPRAEDGVKAGVRYYLRWVTANRAGAAFLLAGRPQDAALRARNRRFFGEVVSWWDTHAHHGVLRALSFDLVHALWLGPAHEYSRHWVAGRGKQVPASVAGVLAEAAWQTVRVSG